MTGTPYHIFFSIEFGPLPSFPLPRGRKRIIQDIGQTREVQGLGELLGVYDIVNKNNRLLDTDPISGMSGLINDLDGGLSFWPKYYTSENELVAVWQPYEMKEYLKEEYFAAHEIKSPEAHLKLKELLRKLDEEDNPVMVIGKLKK